MSTTITHSEAVNIINRNVKGTTMITVDMDSPMDSKMKKTGNPYLNQGLIKKVTLNGLIGFDYAGNVNRLASKEGKDEREAKPRKWGVLTENRLFVTHKEQYYLQMRVEHSTDPVYMLADGSTIPTECVKPFLPTKSKSSTQADLNGEIIVRDIKMENITGMRFKHGDYTLIPEGVNPIKTPVHETEPVTGKIEKIEA